MDGKQNKDGFDVMNCPWIQQHIKIFLMEAVRICSAICGCAHVLELHFSAIWCIGKAAHGPTPKFGSFCCVLKES